ncbi:MAG: hypothetical protein DMG30_24060 [Acidobacteria bacterium]|nr:MAG: hypothetical protein DMG30_24060 [Acidobacteriota bacterium]
MGTRGPTTVLLCGGFQLEGRSSLPSSPIFRKLFTFRERTTAWRPGYTPQIETETRVMRPGAEALVARLSDVLFIQVVRAYFSSPTSAGRDDHGSEP